MPRDIYENTTPRAFSREEEEQKKAIYERMSPRRRRFVDRIGFAMWDPFQLPKDPLDIRTDVTQRTTQELVRAFLQENKDGNFGNDYSKGVLECALGIVNKDEKFKGVFEFCLWYDKLLERERSEKK